ncbi:PREDICTED: uncharacterized protein LOC109116961 [Tarenaya hassleriana]|uniref:uncharacterized protein LOC109116961 n=1 Tax=Tarenaya hassleriana TaxID=28532 RepID=UPI0008FD2056|nr:PREDICTED: uncharacterized protein LOC109116961 [Tarenaya hassleriana]
MATDTNQTEKPFGVSNIKSHIPITLNMDEFNYDAWRELFETHCLSFGVMGHLDGTTQPSGPDDTYWTRIDGLVKLWIYGTISQPMLTNVLKKKSTAQALWTRLENQFRDNKEARAIQLEHELHTLTIGDLSVQEYCQKLKKLSDLLSNIDAELSDRSLVMHMLNGLNEKFDNIVNVIKHKSPFPTFEDARSMLTLEEQRLSKTIRHQPSHTEHSSSPTVLYTETTASPRPPPSWSSSPRPYHQRDGRHGNRRGRQSRGRRFHNNNHNNGPSWNNNWPSFWPNPWAHPAYAPGILGPNPGQQSQARVPSPQWSTHTPPAANVEPATALAQAFNTMTLQNPADNAWYMDSGATAHLTNQPGSSHTTDSSPM